MFNSKIISILILILQIIPIYIISIMGMALAGGYVYRLASQHPEVSWTKSNPEPWNDYKNRQYKVSHDHDYIWLIMESRYNRESFKYSWLYLIVFLIYSL